jgi:hypothetical protein
VQAERTCGGAGTRVESRYACACGCHWVVPPRLQAAECVRSADNFCVSLAVVRRMIEDSEKSVTAKIFEAIRRRMA